MTHPDKHKSRAGRREVHDALLQRARDIRDCGAKLMEEVVPQGPLGLIGDSHTIQALAMHLEDLVHELLNRLAETSQNVLDLDRLRHDVRTPLNQIIGYCDLWLEDEEEDADAASLFRPRLAQLRTAGLALMTGLDAVKAEGSARKPTGHTATRNRTPKASRTPPEGAPEPAESEPKLDNSSQSPADARPPTDGIFAPGRILVVDDNAFNREVLARRLTRQGHTVVEALHGRHALDLLRRDAFDVVLLDIVMPEMDGMEVLQRLKADPRLRHLPIIMISALRDIDRVAQCIQLGADDYLPRPYNAVILKARVDALLERKRLRDREESHLRQIEREKERVDELLHVILPAEAVRELREHGEVRPRRFENVAVLFADVVEFTPYCDTHPAEEVVTHLGRLVERFEKEAEDCGVQKIKTIGDAFMAAAGLLRASADPVLDCVRLGAAMARAAVEMPPHWRLRVGIDVGTVMAGVVGSRQYLFDIWGDTVNTAARVQSLGEPGAVTLTRDAWVCVADQCRATSRGTIPVKGKGEMELFRIDEFVNATSRHGEGRARG